MKIKFLVVVAVFVRFRSGYPPPTIDLDLLSLSELSGVLPSTLFGMFGLPR
jgi:hypothetical protein